MTHHLRFLCFIVCMMFSVCPQLIAQQVMKVPGNKARLSIGTVDTVYSKILGEKREIWVHLPDSIPDVGYAANKLPYPVLYVLDAEANFLSTVGILRAFHSDQANSLCPKMIVVGITAGTSQQRTRDLSPSHVEKAIGIPDGIAKVSGGAENFSSFLEKELFHYIEGHYNTAPFRMLVGHSLGGVFGLHELVNHPDLFNSYILIDPAVHWDNEKTMKQFSEMIKSPKFKQKSLYVAMARNWRSDKDSSFLRSDTSEMSMGSRSVYHLYEVLSQKKPDFTWAFQYYPNDHHATLPHIATYDGLRYIFRYHEIPGYKDLARPDYDAALHITENYQKLYEQTGYRFLPPEFSLYVSTLNFIQENKMTLAFPLAKLLYSNYKDLYSCWALGECYASMKDYKQARKYLAEAISHTPDKYVSGRLEEMKKME